MRYFNTHIISSVQCQDRVPNINIFNTVLVILAGALLTFRTFFSIGHIEHMQVIITKQ